jgi:hypothetical protein
LAIKNSNGKISSKEKVVFRDYLLRQKATLDSKIQGFHIRLTSPLYKELMDRKITDNRLENVGRNTENKIDLSLSSSSGQGGYLNFLLELTGISSVGDRTGLNKRYNNNYNDSNNNDNDNVPIKNKMSNTNTDTKCKTEKLNIDITDKNTPNHENRHKFKKEIPNTHSGKTKNNNQNSDPNSALEILCSQTKLAKLLVKEIDLQLKY